MRPPSKLKVRSSTALLRRISAADCRRSSGVRVSSSEGRWTLRAIATTQRQDMVERLFDGKVFSKSSSVKSGYADDDRASRYGPAYVRSPPVKSDERCTGKAGRRSVGHSWLHTYPFLLVPDRSSRAISARCLAQVVRDGHVGLARLLPFKLAWRAGGKGEVQTLMADVAGRPASCQTGRSLFWGYYQRTLMHLCCVKTRMSACSRYMLEPCAASPIAFRKPICAVSSARCCRNSDMVDVTHDAQGDCRD